MVIDHLLGNGWQLADAEPKVIGSGGPKVLNRHMSVRRKTFLRCCASLEALLKRGLRSLSTQECVAYYIVLLGSPDPDSVPTGLAPKLFREWMDSDGAATLPAAASTGSESESDGEIIGSTSAAAVASKAPPPLQRIASVTDHDFIESLLTLPPPSVAFSAAVAPPLEAVSASAAPAVVPPPPPPPPVGIVVPPPPSEPGMRFLVDATVIVVEAWPQVPIAGQCRYLRYIVQCPVAGLAGSGHCGRCMKRRNAGAAQCRLGAWEPVAFLLVWASMAGQCSSKEEHLRSLPKRPAIVECMRAHNWLP